jgi:hypothetical protein
MSRKALLTVAAGILLSAEAFAGNQDYFDRFSELIQKGAGKLEASSRNRSFPVKGLNDSLLATSRAAQAMARGERDFKAIRSQLTEARRLYPDNVFAILLEAILVNARRGESEATPLFEEFLLRSRKYTRVDQASFELEEFHELRKIVYGLLAGRGVSFRGREGRIRPYLPPSSLLQYLFRPGSFDRTTSILFLVILVTGGAGLAWYGLRTGEFFRPLPSFLSGLYLAVWVAYSVWLFDIAVGLPGGFSRFKVIPPFLGFITIILGAQSLIKFLKQRFSPLEKGARVCRHCGAVVPGIMLECTDCRRAL